jgi:glycosyltransferase involved in cell wall biosynthesis
MPLQSPRAETSGKSGGGAARLEGLSVVLPCYNEEKVIRKVVTEVAEFLPAVADRFEIIAVNDGSTDRTGAILEELAAGIPQLVVVHHDPNRGYGAALRSGFSRARLDYVFYTDSDGQFDISELPVLLPHTRDADIVTGYRKNRKDPLHRKFNAGLFKSFARLVLGIRLRDIDCAFKVYRREVLDSLDLLSDGILIDTEIFYKAKRKGYSVREVPVTHLPRSGGAATGNRLDVIFRVFRELPKLRRGRH